MAIAQAYLIHIFFDDDCNLSCEHKNISKLEECINSELSNAHTWPCANRLSLNIDKSNYVTFHPPQNNIKGINLILKIR